MIISWKEDETPIITAKAVGFKIKHNGKVKVMWCPKSLLISFEPKNRLADVPDKIYDEKITELFLGGVK